MKQKLKFVSYLFTNLIGILTSSCKKGKLSGKSVGCDMYTISLQLRFCTEQVEELYYVDDSSQV